MLWITALSPIKVLILDNSEFPVMSLKCLDKKSCSFDCNDILELESVELSTRLLFGVDTEMTTPFLLDVLCDLGVRLWPSLGSWDRVEVSAVSAVWRESWVLLQLPGSERVLLGGVAATSDRWLEDVVDCWLGEGRSLAASALLVVLCRAGDAIRTGAQTVSRTCCSSEIVSWRFWFPTHDPWCHNSPEKWHFCDQYRPWSVLQKRSFSGDGRPPFFLLMCSIFFGHPRLVQIK